MRSGSIGWVGRAAAGAEKRKALWRSAEFRGWALCLPALLILGVFFLGPAIVGVRVSLTDWDGASSTMRYVGLSNYAQLFQEDRFWNAMKVNWLVAGGTLLTQIPIALGLALILSKKGVGMRFFRSAIFAPQVLSIAAVALIWSLILDPFQGFVNQALGALGVGHLARGWLGEAATALPAMLFVTTWFYFGFHMILFMAGLAAIPGEYFEAARLETDRWYHVLRHVTLPLLREPLLISFILVFSGAFGHLIGLFSIMTQGGPAGRTELLGLYMVSQAFRGSRFGYASAVSVVILLVVLAVIVWPALRVARERLEYT